MHLDITLEDANEPLMASLIARIYAMMSPETREQFSLLAVRATYLDPLRLVHGNTVADATAILGTTTHAVKVRAHRGYVRLRKVMCEHHEPRRDRI
jgi:hypothetical protein